MDFYVVESSYTECRPIGSVLIKFHVEHKRQTATDATNLTMMQQLQQAKLRWCDGMTTGNIPTKESTSEQVEWERKLTAGGFAVNGIDLCDPEEVKEVFRTLGVSDREFAKKSRVRAFIKKSRSQQGETQSRGTYPFTDSIYILYSKMDNNVVDVIATAFAVAAKLALTYSWPYNSKPKRQWQSSGDRRTIVSHKNPCAQ